ncbi:hypothetical protein ABFS83_07G006900 [Erythranthe nasuta]
MSSRKINNITSSSEDDGNRSTAITDEKKMKRMKSNRESARRSRMKREQHIKDLNDQVTYFKTRSSEIARKISEIEARFTAVGSENRILRMKGEDLKKRLELLEEMLASDHQVNDDCLLMDILQDPLIKPWMQHTFDSQTIDGIYQF